MVQAVYFKQRCILLLPRAIFPPCISYYVCTYFIHEGRNEVDDQLPSIISVTIAAKCFPNFISYLLASISFISAFWRVLPSQLMPRKCNNSIYLYHTSIPTVCMHPSCALSSINLSSLRRFQCFVCRVLPSRLKHGTKARKDWVAIVIQTLTCHCVM